MELVGYCRVSKSDMSLDRQIDMLVAAGAEIKSLKESCLDTTTPQGRLLFTIFSGLSQFEAELTAERTRDGLRVAATRGRKGGRPSKRTDKELTVKTLYSSGVKIAEIVRQTALSRSTVNRIIRDMRVIDS